VMFKLVKPTVSGASKRKQAMRRQKKAEKDMEAKVVEFYGRLKSSAELDLVLDEKLAFDPAQRASIRAYVQSLIPHLRDN
jgi:hypothetical protein